MVRKIVTDQSRDKIDAETARRLEGQSLARWLSEEVLGKAAILNRRGERVCAQPRDVAILLRKLTDIHDYLEPLRSKGIRYVVEGERQFYAAKEIVDTINLLRALENPNDRLALVGVLRSPLGGLTDTQIYELHRRRLLDYRAVADLDAALFPPSLPQLYAVLAQLHETVPTMRSAERWLMFSARCLSSSSQPAISMASRLSPICRNFSVRRNSSVTKV